MTACRRPVAAALAALVAVAGSAREAAAHAGPPYPIVSNRVEGPYLISVWTDPDATDDGSAGGQFWITLEPARDASPLPPDTRARVSIAPRDGTGDARTGRAEPVDGRVDRQFVALVMDHEGPFAVHVDVAGPMGNAQVDAEVQATYDLRPPPVMLVLYLVPFLVAGGLWLKLLRQRRGRTAAHRTRSGRMHTL